MKNTSDEQMTTCSYTNRSDNFQVLRIEDMKCYMEKIVRQDETIFFEAKIDAYLNIYTIDSINSILSDKICCKRLALNRN
jgi:hypothetical protein